MIAAIGIAVLDNIVVMDGFQKGEGSFYCNTLTVTGGGMAATALCAASKLGSPTRLFTKVGDDAHGHYIIDELHSYDIDTSGSVIVPGLSTTSSIVFVDSHTGEKQFYSERDKPLDSMPATLDRSLLDGTNVLLVDGHWIDGALDGVEWAASNAIPVVADFKRMYDGLDSLFPSIDYLIIPSFFAEEITGEKTVDGMLEKLAAMQKWLPVITCGENGGKYFIDGAVRRYRAFQVPCVDSTGAGDAFHGAFCHFLSHDLPVDRCLELASAVGALNCRSLGGRSSLPSREELRQFLKEQGSSPEFP